MWLRFSNAQVAGRRGHAESFFHCIVSLSGNTVDVTLSLYFASGACGIGSFLLRLISEIVDVTLFSYLMASPCGISISPSDTLVLEAYFHTRRTFLYEATE